MDLPGIKNHLLKSFFSNQFGCRHCTVHECNSKLGAEDGQAAVEAGAALGEAGGIPESVDKWHYINQSSL